MIARRALKFAAAVEGSNVGPELLEQLRDEVRHVARLYPVTPLAHLMGSLAELQDVVFRLLEGRQRPAETADLFLLSGIVSGMLAKASHDFGNSHAAMTHARAAIVCAENAGHDGLRAWLRVLQSMIAYWSGSLHQAARFAEAGAEYAARTRSTAAVWLPSQTARVWGVLGHAERVREAIAQAAQAREQVEPDDLDQFGGIMTFTPQRQLYYAADAMVWLPGREAEAADTARRAVTA